MAWFIPLKYNYGDNLRKDIYADLDLYEITNSSAPFFKLRTVNFEIVRLRDGEVQKNYERNNP